ncbi:MAG TPA: hypothetical protein VLS90_08825 [Thermodesulfobacteriota bacterium]|nr:hypothetical protein [Thermodesulfobacteriota bacterium]
MDIKKIGEAALPIPPGVKKGRPGGTGDVDFQTVLKNAQGGEGDSRASNVADAFFPGTVIPPLAANPMGEPGRLSSLQALGTRASEALLDALDRYQTALADSRSTLKEISPLLSSLSGQARDLAEIGSRLPDSDPLRKIIGELEILSSVEVEKFNRGDYV